MTPRHRFIPTGLHGLMTSCLGALVFLSSCRSSQSVLRYSVPGSPELALTELRSFRLPPGEDVLGAIQLTDQMVLYWSPQAAWLVSETGRRLVTCRRGVSRILAAGRIHETVLVLDTAANAVFKVLRTGECRELYRLSLRRPIAAIPTAAGWLAIDRQADGHPELLFFAYDRVTVHDRVTVPARSHELPVLTPDTSSVAWLSLSPTARGVILSTRRWPFSWIELDAEGNVLGGLRPTNLEPQLQVPIIPIIGGSHAQLDLWYALPPLDLGRGFLRVLADLGSDRRTFEVYDRSGKLLRSRQLVSPIGLFSANENTVLGVRISDGAEIVQYSWRWHN